MWVMRQFLKGNFFFFFFLSRKKERKKEEKKNPKSTWIVIDSKFNNSYIKPNNRVFTLRMDVTEPTLVDTIFSK